MSSKTNSKGVAIPKANQWPGAFNAYKLVGPFIRPKIWRIVGALGIYLGVYYIVALFIFSIFKGTITGAVITYIFEIFFASLLQVALISMYFSFLNGDDMSLNEAFNEGFNKLWRMTSALIITAVIIVVSFVLLVIPFIFIFPRVILIPYFLVAKNLSVSESINLSWHLTKDHKSLVWGVVGVNFLIALLCLTIIGIPFSIYMGLINSGSYALLVMYLLKNSGSQKAAKVTD